MRMIRFASFFLIVLSTFFTGCSIGVTCGWGTCENLKRYADELGPLLEKQNVLVRDSGWIIGASEKSFLNELKTKIYVKKFLESEVVDFKKGRVRFSFLVENEVYCKIKEDSIYIGSYRNEISVVLECSYKN